MEFDPRISGYDTSNESSFAYVSAHDRWSVILAGAISDVYETLNTNDDLNAMFEGEKIIKGLRALHPLPGGGFHDIAGYNEELKQRDTTWMNDFWLYGECYLYRRIHTLFYLSKNWKDYDSLQDKRYRLLDHQNRLSLGSAPEKHIFQEMCEICPCGNATDLSLLTSLTYEDIQTLQGAEARETQEKNVLVNDIPAAFDFLNNARQERNNKENSVDIVLFYAGLSYTSTFYLRVLFSPLD
ncbi:hypothetical protein RU639_001437 [Aspergillus parasiticus]